MPVAAPVRTKSDHMCGECAEASRENTQAVAPPAVDARAAGNLAVQRLRRAPLEVGAPDDPAEREAESVAARVVRGQSVNGAIARQTTAAAGSGGRAAPDVVNRVLAGSGTPLPNSVRRTMEPKFGQDFADVRVHNGSAAAESAAAIDARAYTLGNDIVLGGSAPSMESTEGQDLLAHELTHVVQQTPGGGAVQRDLLDDLTGAVADIGAGVAEAVGDLTGAVADAGAGVAEAVGLPTSLAEILGFPAPADGSPDTLRLILQAAENPAVRAVAGTLLPPGTAEAMQATLLMLDVAWDVYENPEPFLNQIHEGLQSMMDGAGPLASETAAAAVPSTTSADGETALAGVMRHLLPKIEYIGANWWEVLKGIGWDMLWPWPGVADDFSEAFAHILSMGQHLWNLEISAAYDDWLAVLRHVNAAAGRVYGWFFLASILVGGLIGLVGGGVGSTPAGGAGAAPGALAGAATGLAFAGFVGEALVASTVIIEGASIGKAAFNLSQSDRTGDQRECDCEIIASSSLTVGVTGAMFVLGGLAARFGKRLVQDMFNKIWERPGTRGPRSEGPRRGDVIADSHVLAELTKTKLNQKRITVTDEMSSSKNFAGLDMARDSTVLVQSRATGETLTTASAVKAAINNREGLRVEFTGGDVVQVKSHQIGRSVKDQIRGEIRDLARLTDKTWDSHLMVVTNPAKRSLVEFLQAPLTAAELANVTALAQELGVTLEIVVGALPSGHPAIVALEAVPGALGELGSEAGREAGETTGEPLASCP